MLFVTLNHYACGKLLKISRSSFNCVAHTTVYQSEGEISITDDLHELLNNL